MPIRKDTLRGTWRTEDKAFIGIVRPANDENTDKWFHNVPDKVEMINRDTDEDADEDVDVNVDDDQEEANDDDSTSRSVLYEEQQVKRKNPTTPVKRSVAPQSTPKRRNLMRASK